MGPWNHEARLGEDFEACGAGRRQDYRESRGETYGTRGGREGDRASNGAASPETREANRMERLRPSEVRDASEGEVEAELDCGEQSRPAERVGKHRKVEGDRQKGDTLRLGGGAPPQEGGREGVSFVHPGR